MDARYGDLQAPGDPIHQDTQVNLYLNLNLN